MLENTEGAIKKGQSRKTGKIGYTRQRKTKQKKKNVMVYMLYNLYFCSTLQGQTLAIWLQLPTA